MPKTRFNFENSICLLIKKNKKYKNVKNKKKNGVFTNLVVGTSSKRKR